MIELNANNLKKTFGADLIFEQISFDIKTNERIGIVGPNGCGKTTLLKILYGTENVIEGNISFRKGSKLGYLDQIPDYKDLLVIDIINMAFEEVYNIKKQLDLLALKLSENKDIDKTLKEYTRLTEVYERLDGYNTETEINKVCSGLKITDQMRTMEFSLLSGGEKTRIMLAKILLEKPTILMLDEPSNHLDLESIEWLETYLTNYEGSVLIVSHDRYFLDNVCKKIIEISINKAHVYHGNYSYYVIEKERRFLLELKVYLSQQRQIKRMEEQIKRYRIWGVMRDSDKMFKRAKELEKRLSKIERLDQPKQNADKMRMKKQNTSRSGKRVLEAQHIYKSFDELVLLEDASLELIYQDRLSILGNNGTGKTTLIKLLLEDFENEEPIYKWGSKLKIGYLAQAVKFQDENISILDYFMREHNVSQNEARSELAKALFIRDDVLKKIRVLSGGEKSKLKLCSLTFNQTNLLVLDEPTNHLDIDSREVLEEMLLEFEGTILFISHDRYFIKKIASRIGEINNLQITYYEGDYEYYRYKRQVVKQPKQKKQKQKKKQPKKEIEINYLQDLETLEEHIHNTEQEMKLHAYDLEKLQELHQQKETYLKQYNEIYNKIES